jgi:hypothetical protein
MRICNLRSAQKGTGISGDDQTHYPTQTPCRENKAAHHTSGRRSSLPLIIGEHGTGKTSLIKLAVNGMDEPKGIVYVDIPLKRDLEVGVINEARML